MGISLHFILIIIFYVKDLDSRTLRNTYFYMLLLYFKQAGRKIENMNFLHLFIFDPGGLSIHLPL